MSTAALIERRVFEVARGEIGERENVVRGHGTNRGRRVDEYQRADLLPGLGYAWCSSFFAWVLLTALGKPLCDRVWLRSASCDSVLSWARSKRIVSNQPSFGAAGLVMAPGSTRDATHIFLCGEVLSGKFRTIEGNTNVDGGREGIGVFARTRPMSSRYLFVHWDKLLPGIIDLPEKLVLPPKLTAAADKPKSIIETAQKRELWWGNGMIDNLPLIDGHAWIPAWKWAEWTKGTGKPQLAWNMASQSVSIRGREVAAQPMIFNSRAWLPLTALAEHSGRTVEVNDAQKRLVLH